MKIGVIGLGKMGRSHAAHLRKMALVSDLLGCDLMEGARAAAEAEGVRTVSTVDALLAWKPDAVFVITPAATHTDAIEPCLRAGIPVLTEKPLATDIKDCRRLVALAERNRVPFQVGFELRYCGLTQGMRNIVKSGLVGKPLSMSLVQISGPGKMTREVNGGIFWEKLCHEVDLFRYWFGEPDRVMAIASPNALKQYTVSDNVLSCLSFPNGRLGKITFFTTRAAQVGGTDDHGDRGHFYEITLTCTKGSLTYCAWTDLLSVVRFNHRPDYQSELVEQIPVRKTFGEPMYALTEQNGDFLTRVKAGRKLQFPAADALQSMEWVNRAEQSLLAGGKWLRASRRGA